MAFAVASKHLNGLFATVGVAAPALAALQRQLARLLCSEADRLLPAPDWSLYRGHPDVCV